MILLIIILIIIIFIISKPVSELKLTTLVNAYNSDSELMKYKNIIEYNRMMYHLKNNNIKKAFDIYKSFETKLTSQYQINKHKELGNKYF
jgi:hypothetical protein